MDRRQFILTGSALTAAMAAAPAAMARQAAARPLTVDAMGEVRFEYDAALIGQMRASGQGLE